MHPVTQDYLEAVSADERRIKAKIQIDYTDPFMDQSISISTSEQANVSYPVHTADAINEPYAKFAALDGAWVLDGTFALAPGTFEAAETKQMGWWGSVLAGVGGVFVEPYPALTVTHFGRPVHRIRVTGDNKRGEYPVDFTVTIYDAADTVLHEEIVTGNNEVFYVRDITPVTQAAKQVLRIQRWSHEGHQVKILELFTSIQEIYEGDDILLIHLLEERDVSQGSLPVGNISANEIDIRLENRDRKFDAGNTQSPLYQLLKANRRIKAWLGVKAENLESENPPTFSRASTAYLSDGTEVASGQPRFEQGGVLVEEGTTNLLSENAASFETSTAIGSYAPGVSPTISLDSSVSWHGNKSAKLTANSTGQIETWWSTWIPVTPGVVYTFSCHTKESPANSKTVQAALSFRNSAGSIVSTTSGNSVPASEGWKRVTVTGTAPETADRVYLYIYLNGTIAVGDVQWLDGAQFEQKAYPTSFHPTTRADDNLATTRSAVGIPATSADAEWTIEVFTRPDKLKMATTTRANLFEIGNYHILGETSITLRSASANSLQIVTYENQIGKDAAHLNFSTAEYDTPMLLAVRYKAGVLTLTAHTNQGVKTDSGLSINWTHPLADILRLGGYGWKIGDWNGVIYDVRVSSRARTDQEIADAYATGELTADKDTTYLLTFNRSIYPVETCWLPLGTFWSGDWNAPEHGVYAQTTGRDRLELLRKSTYSTSQVAVSTTLYNLAEGVLLDAGLTPEEFWIDPELQNYPVPYAWFNPVSHREALRLIAEACMGQAYAARDGLVRVEGPSFLAGQAQSVITLTQDDYFRKDNPVKWSEIANYVEVETQPLRPVSVAEEVYRSNDPVSINVAQTKSITIHYNEPPVIEAVASLESAPDGASITEVTYYAWGANVKVHSPNAGEFILVVNGKPLRVINKERAIAQNDASITDNGRLRYRFPDNHLVQTLTVAQKIADTLITTYKDPRRDIELQWRGNPAMELADRVTAPDYKDISTAEYFVVSQTLEFDGSLRSMLRGRKAG